MTSIKFLIILVVTLANAIAQRPLFYGLPKPWMVSSCLRETGVTAHQVSRWEAQSTNCRDVFGEIDDARHFHVCLITKQGYVDKHENANLTTIYRAFPNMNPAYLFMVYEICDTAFVSTGRPFERAYHYNKCILEQLGAYPWGSRTLTIVGDTNKEFQKECRQEVGISEAELCTLKSNTKEDAFDTNQKGRCYTLCLARKYGYLSGTEINVQVLVDRYSYKPANFFEEALKQCIRPMTEENICEAIHEIHKCFRIFYGEYPVDYSISPRDVQFIISPHGGHN